MFMEIKFLFGLLLVGLLVSCNEKNTLQRELDEISEKYSYFSPDGWILKKSISDQFGAENYIEKKSGDTIFAARYFSQKSSYRLYNFNIKFISDSNLHHTRINDWDTAFYYIHSINSDSIYFLKGYYTFLYSEGFYSPNDLDFYFDNKDSLDAVKDEYHLPPEIARKYLQRIRPELIDQFVK